MSGACEYGLIVSWNGNDEGEAFRSLALVRSTRSGLVAAIRLQGLHEGAAALSTPIASRFDVALAPDPSVAIRRRTSDLDDLDWFRDPHVVRRIGPSA